MLKLTLSNKSVSNFRLQVHFKHKVYHGYHWLHLLYRQGFLFSRNFSQTTSFQCRLYHTVNSWLKSYEKICGWNGSTKQCETTTRLKPGIIESVQNYDKFLRELMGSAIWTALADQQRKFIFRLHINKHQLSPSSCPWWTIIVCG